MEFDVSRGEKITLIFQKTMNLIVDAINSETDLEELLRLSTKCSKLLEIDTKSFN